MKAAFVVTRYGLEINGGAELHCRLLAEKMKTSWDIDILTTCALDYLRWENHYAAGLVEINGLKVRRFTTDYPRPLQTFNSCYNLLSNLHLLNRCREDVALDTAYHRDLLLGFATAENPSTQAMELNHGELEHLLPQLETLWLRSQGPMSSGLLEYIRTHSREYDIFIFFSYNYATTVYGLPLVKERALLVPTLHAEACAGFSLFQDLFAMPRYFLFNTKEEQQLAQKIFPSTKICLQDVVGVGIDEQPSFDADDKPKGEFIPQVPYLLYVGRIEESKGCRELFQYFINFKKHYVEELKLVLIGKAFMELPQHEDILPLGFVSEATKSLLLSNALIFVMPSPYESLSMALLEAWQQGLPALVNGRCAVLRGHCERSRGGFFYENEEAFHRQLGCLLTRPLLCRGLGKMGQAYVRDHYRWQDIIAKYEVAAQQVLTDQAMLGK